MDNEQKLCCPICGAETGIMVVIPVDGESLRRRRICLECGYTFMTEEVDADYLARIERRIKELLNK